MTHYPREIEETTAATWLKAGAIQLETTGSENSYYRDEFDNEFFCKNYPEHYGVRPARGELLASSAGRLRRCNGSNSATDR